MNLFQIILKNMRQRALGTWLTLLSVMLGVMLSIAVLIVYREGKSLFGQTEFGYDVIVGINRGSPMQLVMNTVYHIDQSPGNIPYAIYEDLLTEHRRNVKIAVPIAVGDSYRNHRIVATLPKMFGYDDDGVTKLPADQVIEYIKDHKYEIAEGRVFHGAKFEAVIGSDVPTSADLPLGGEFNITHGTPAPGQAEDVHAEKWKVVGRLRKTGTAVDRVIFIALPTFYAIADHEEGLEAQAKIREAFEGKKAANAARDNPADDHDHDHATPSPTATKPIVEDHDHDHDDHGPTPTPSTTAAATDDHDDHAEPDAHAGHDHGAHAYDVRADGSIELHLPKKDWVLSAVLVKGRGAENSGPMVRDLMYKFFVRNDALAVNPASVMREFFDTFMKGSTLVLLLVSGLVTVVAAVGILVSIYNSVAARKREIAILRALGATRGKVLALICLEAGLIGLIGGVAGLIGGHVVAAIGSNYLMAYLGQGIGWHTIGTPELLYLAGVVILATLAGLVPAAAAYRTPVATNLVVS